MPGTACIISPYHPSTVVSTSPSISRHLRLNGFHSLISSADDKLQTARTAQPAATILGPIEREFVVRFHLLVGVRLLPVQHPPLATMGQGPQ